MSSTNINVDFIEASWRLSPSMGFSELLDDCFGDNVYYLTQRVRLTDKMVKYLSANDLSAGMLHVAFVEGLRLNVGYIDEVMSSVDTEYSNWIRAYQFRGLTEQSRRFAIKDSMQALVEKDTSSLTEHPVLVIAKSVGSFNFGATQQEHIELLTKLQTCIDKAHHFQNAIRRMIEVQHAVQIDRMKSLIDERVNDFADPENTFRALKEGRLVIEFFDPVLQQTLRTEGLDDDRLRLAAYQHSKRVRDMRDGDTGNS